MLLKWPWSKLSNSSVFNLKVDGQLFLYTGVSWKREEKKVLKNKWFSVSMDLSETISSVYTPAVGTRRAWASWSVGSGGDGALWVTSMHKWLPVRKAEGGRMGGGAIFCLVKPLGRTWMIHGDTSATCFGSVNNLLVETEGGGEKWKYHSIYKFVPVYTGHKKANVKQICQSKV